MAKLFTLIAALVCFSMTAAAQDATAAFDAANPSAEPDAAPAQFSPSDRPSWQLEAGAQYQHYRVLGVAFHDFGFNASVTRYLNNWFGLEGAAAVGFGHTGTTLNVTAPLDAKSFFIGGGPHVAISNRTRFEPWAHALVGLQHFRFTQTNTKVGLGSNSALGFQLGGGVDFKIIERAFWRVQADYVGSHFSAGEQTNYSVGTGLVFNF